MTLVSKTTRLRNEDYTQDGRVFNSSGAYIYRNTEGSAALTSGEWSYSRVQCDIPKGAIITSAVLKFRIGPKDRAQAGSVTMNIGCEGVDNSARLPEPDDSTVLFRSYNNTAWVAQGVVINHVANDPEAADDKSLTFTTQLQAWIDREGYESGNYLNIIFEPTAKSGTQMSLCFRDNAFWSQQIELVVTYQVEDLSPDVIDVNLHIAQSPESTLGPVGKNVSFDDGTFYNTRATGTTWQIVSGTGTPVGVQTTRVTANPAAGEETRRFGIYSYQEAVAGEWVSFSGWFYNPSVNQGNFTGEFVFLGGGSLYTERDQWHPFETEPHLVTDPSEAEWLWVGLTHTKQNDGTTNAYFLVDGLTFHKWRGSSKPPKTFPFTAWTVSNRFRYHEHKGSSWDREGSIRRRANDVYVLDGSVAKPKSRWARSITKPVSVALVPGSTRRASLCAGIMPIALGTVTLTENVSYLGRTWTRVTSGATANHGVRLNVPLNRLTNNIDYTAAWLVANDGASAVTVNVDWCDIAVTSVSVPPGEMRVITASGQRATYDATFRFTDMVLSAPSTSILFAPYETRVVVT